MSVGVVLLGLVAALVLVAMNGFFAAAEFALVSVRRTRVDELIAQGNATARVVRHVIDDPDRFIAAIQVGVTVASLGLGWIGESVFADVLAPLLIRIPGPWGEVLAHSIAGGMAFAIITFLLMVLGELAPKSIALQYPEQASLVVARPIVVTETILRPFIWLLNGTGTGLLKLFGVDIAPGHFRVHSAEELRMLMRESQEGGAIEARQEQMLQKVFQFGDRQVREAMIPRPDIVGVEASDTLCDFLPIFCTASHSRFPVYVENLDNVVGFLAVKDVLMKLAEGAAPATTQVRELTRPVPFVPETRLVSSLFAEMRSHRQQLAIVLDEFGGTAGLVTLEELVEEIVGRISDELVEEAASVLRLGRDTFLIDAQMRIDEVNEQLDLDLPDGEDYETVAGFILYHLGRVPAEGDVLRHEGLELGVTRMKGPKIEKVQIRR